jgi:hypothetical protein
LLRVGGSGNEVHVLESPALHKLLIPHIRVYEVQTVIGQETKNRSRDKTRVTAQKHAGHKDLYQGSAKPEMLA